YVPGDFRRIKIESPEAMPVVGIYHPDAPKLFETFQAYKKWYERKRQRSLDRDRTIGLLLMRPQVISDAHRHYDGLIRGMEAEGLCVIPAISSFMDYRDSCSQFFVEAAGKEMPLQDLRNARVSQVVSLTGFSFVGGPAMNDSQAAAEFLKELNVLF